MAFALELQPVHSAAWGLATAVAAAGELAFILVMKRAVADLAGTVASPKPALAAGLRACSVGVLLVHNAFVVAFLAARICGGAGAGSCVSLALEARLLCVLEAARAAAFVATLRASWAAARSADGVAPAVRALSTHWWACTPPARAAEAEAWRRAWSKFSAHHFWLPAASLLFAAAVRASLCGATLPTPAAGSAGAEAVEAAQAASLTLLVGAIGAVFLLKPLIFSSAHAHADAAGVAVAPLPEGFGRQLAMHRGASMLYNEEPHVTVLFVGEYSRPNPPPPAASN